MKQATMMVFGFFMMFALLGDARGLEKRAIAPDKKGLVVYHFDEPNITKHVGVDFGPWELHPSHITEIDVVRSKDKKEYEEYGNVLRIAYDVSIPDEDLPYANYPVFNGVWFRLADADISEYDTLVMSVRGDKEAGYTHRFKVELKNNDGEIATFYVDGVRNEWRRVEKPLVQIKTNMGRELKSYKSMKEMTIVFEKQEVTERKGVIYIDNIHFTGPR